MGKPWVVQSSIRTRVVGGSAEVTYDIMKKKTTDWLNAGETSHESPTPLIQTIELPGTDIPFNDFGLDTEPYYNLARIKRERRYRRILEYTRNDNAHTPTAILDLPPDENTLRVHKLAGDDVYNQFRFDKKIRRTYLSFLTDEWKGLPPYYIPATSFPGSASSIFSEIQAHMLEETINGGLTWELWSETEVLAYLNERVAKFLVESDLLRDRTSIAVTAGTSGVDLPSNVLQVRRVTWIDSSLSSPTVLRPISEMEASLNTLTLTQAYSDNPETSLHLTLYATPTYDGTLYISYIPTSTVTAVSGSIPLPGVFLPYIKYGVMADMFNKEGEANDPKRAEYCENRWQEGLELANILIGGAK